MEWLTSNVLSAIKNNISWISSIFTIMFSLVATIIAVLTYQKAKKSLLQPVKSEVMKKQTSIIASLLAFLSKSGGFDRGFDYEGIVYLSLFGLLKDFGFLMKNMDNFSEKQKELGSGLIVVSRNEVIERFEKDKPIVEPGKDTFEERKIDFGKKKYEELKKGIIDIDVLYSTKSHDMFERTITEYAENPFMPSEIVGMLHKILDTSSINVKKLIKESLEEFFIQYSKHFFAGNKESQISFGGVYNIFNEKRISHKTDESLMRTKIREFMRVDEGWE